MKKKTVRRKMKLDWLIVAAFAVYATVKAIELAKLERGVEAIGGEALTPVLVIVGWYLLKHIANDIKELFWEDDPYDTVLR